MSLSCKEQGRLADAELELEECTSCLVRSEMYLEALPRSLVEDTKQGCCFLVRFPSYTKGHNE